MLSKFLDWLEHYKWVNLLILFVYFNVAVLPHIAVGKLTVKVFGSMPRDQYNLLIAALSTTALLVYIIPVVKFIKESKTFHLLYYLIANIIFAVLCFKIIFVINIEAIHFFQYAIFAILCYPLVKNYTLTLIYTTIAGAIDEAYQFYYLAPEKTKYYDFNDVIINLVGAVFGLILIRSLSREFRHFDFIGFLKSIHSKLLALPVIFISTLFATGLLVVNYNPENTIAKYWLIREPATGFWSEVPPHIIYHAVQPLVGCIIVIFLWLFFSRLYKGSPIITHH